MRRITGVNLGIQCQDLNLQSFSLRGNRIKNKIEYMIKYLIYLCSYRSMDQIMSDIVDIYIFKNKCKYACMNVMIKARKNE